MLQVNGSKPRLVAGNLPADHEVILPPNLVIRESSNQPRPVTTAEH
jgi:hypothetical protein